MAILFVFTEADWPDYCKLLKNFCLRRTVAGRRGGQDGLGERACVVLEGDGSLFLNSSGYQAFPGQIGQHSHIQIAKPEWGVLRSSSPPSKHHL